MRYRIGTRGSKLALAQAESVQKRLAEYFPEHEFELSVVKTTGDRVRETPLGKIGTKGIFTREIEEGLLEGTLDLAVHSMKDMPGELPLGLMLSGAWQREDARDALVLRACGSLEELPCGAVIATGSLRRKYQLLRLRPDLEVVDIRGNVETRIRKMEEQKLDGLVLAAAGLKRLHLEDRITGYFAYEEMIPAPAQGALAVEFAEGRRDIKRLLAPFEDERVSREIDAERRFLALMGGGCHLPVGAVAEAAEDGIRLRAVYGDAGGGQIVFADAMGETSEEAAEQAAQKIRDQMGQK